MGHVVTLAMQQNRVVYVSRTGIVCEVKAYGLMGEVGPIRLFKNGKSNQRE